jgi:hypothetical protein
MKPDRSSIYSNSSLLGLFLFAECSPASLRLAHHNDGLKTYYAAGWCAAYFGSPMGSFVSRRTVIVFPTPSLLPTSPDSHCEEMATIPMSSWATTTPNHNEPVDLPRGFDHARYARGEPSQQDGFARV